MSMQGLGVMIQELCGNEESVNAYKSAIGKKIQKVIFDDTCLTLNFTDRTSINFTDDGQSCCESRYMTNEGDTYEWAHLAIFNGAELKDAPDGPDEHGEPHECQFLEILTSKGVITVTSHVEHNGYYGGFAIRVHPGKW